MAIQRTEPAVIEMTYGEFAVWLGEDMRAEWVKGRVIEFMPPTERHQELIAWLTSLLYLFVRFRRLGKALPTPFEMKLDVIPSSRQPDIVVSLATSAGRMDGKRLNGAADLAIEIIADDSVARDRRDKFAEYALAGVSEYWIDDPVLGRYSFQAYTLTDEDYFVEMLPNDAGKIESSVLPGFWLDPNWIGQDPLPDPLQTFLSIAPDAGRTMP